MVHVASSRKLHGDDAEDGRIGVIGYVRFIYPTLSFLLY
jgi:hypothetical protein